MAAALRMFKYMVRTTHPVEFPSIALQYPDQLGTFHVCIIHTTDALSRFCAPQSSRINRARCAAERIGIDYRPAIAADAFDA